jgi:DNA ligase-associated metallophosphoesterase
MLQVILQGEEMILLPGKALYWPKQKTIIIADLHWGKSAHFRKNGIAIPADTQRQDEKRLSALIKDNYVEQLIIAGDLFHSKANKETDDFIYWRNAHSSLHIGLIGGNHDILPEDKYLSLNIELHSAPYHIAPFMIAHHPIENPTQFIIHGHIHPAIRISGKGQQSVKLCCFAANKNSLVLPAFGDFTGTHLLNETGYSHIYVVADNKVIQWK